MKTQTITPTNKWEKAEKRRDFFKFIFENEFYGTQIVEKFGVRRAA